MTDIYDAVLDEEEQRAKQDVQNSDNADPAAKYSEYLDNEAQQRTARLNASLNIAVQGNPEKAAQAASLASQAGLPPVVVERNQELVAQQQRVRQLQDLAKMSPVLARQLEDPEFAKIAHDDAETLSDLELNLGWAEKVDRAAQRAVWAGFDYAGKSAQSIYSGAVPRTNAALWDVARAGADVVSKYLTGPLAGTVLPMDPAATASAFFAQERAQQLAHAKRVEPKTDGLIDTSVQAGFQSVGQNLVTAPLAIATGNPELMLYPMAAVTGGQAYGEARDAGVSVPQSLSHALSQATIEYATEKLPVSALIGDLKAGAPYWKLIMHQLATEIPGEQVATLLQDLNDWATLHPDRPFSSYLAERPSAAAQTLIATAVATAAHSAIATSVNKAVGGLLDGVDEAQNAQREAMALARLAQLAAASKLRERAPDTFAEFVQQAAEEGPVQDVYVNGAVLQQTLAQSGVPVPASVTQQLPEALATGGDVKISLGDYTAYLAASDAGNALLQHLKTSPESMSQAEAQQFMQEQAQVFQKQAEEILSGDSANAQAQADAEVVRQHFFDQLAQANRFTPDVNGAYATLLRDFYVTTAQRLGISPVEMLQRYPLRVAAESVATDSTAAVIDHSKISVEGSSPEFAAWEAKVAQLRRRFSELHAKAQDQTGDEQSRTFDEIDRLKEEMKRLDAEMPRRASLDQPTQDAINQAIALVGEQKFQELGERALLEERGRQAAAGRTNITETERQAVIERLARNVLKTGNGNFENALNQPLSTRVPTAVKAQENPLEDHLVIGLDAAKADPNAFAKNVALISKYVNFPANVKTRSPEKRAEIFINEVMQNLLWLHDSVPEATRARSKLWYDGARAIVDRWVAKYGLTDAQVAGALAMLSPQKDWFMNVSLAERVLDAMTFKQDHEWDEKMTATAARIFAKEGYAEDVGEITGKTLAQIESPYLKAMWVRTYDEAHNPRHYAVVTPEGNFAEYAKNLDGKTNSKVAWGSLSEIGKAISVIQNGDLANISAQLGEQHKVRNFYNNIVAPNDPTGSVTIDTHAVAAALLRPLAGASLEVGHNFGALGAASSSIFGAKGTYGIYAEAYRRAAVARGLLPRELQSITWEAVRGLYEAKFKAQQRNVDAIDKIWLRYRQGKATLDETRQAILERAGGITAPEWERSGGGEAAPTRASTYTGELLEAGVPGRRADTAAGGGGSAAAGSAQPAATGVLAGGTGRVDGLAEAQALAEKAAGGTAKLVGLPDKPLLIDGEWYIPGPVAIAHEAAHAYMRTTDREYNPPKTFQKVNVERARRIAQAYAEMKHAPKDPLVKAAYDAMIKETIEQYRVLLATGLKVEFIDFAKHGDPYASSPRAAIQDVVKNNHLWVFSTRDGFGSDATFDPSSNPLLQETEFKISGKTALANDLFRVVHDYFGHIKDGNGFRADGEENAWRSHAAMYSPLARRAMTSETRGQNSWVNFGPHGEKNQKATAADTVYADQKTGLLPEWVSEEGAGDPQLNILNQPLQFEIGEFGDMGGGEGGSNRFHVGALAYKKEQTGLWHVSLLHKKGVMLGGVRYLDNLTNEDVQRTLGEALATRIFAGEGESGRNPDLKYINGLDVQVDLPPSAKLEQGARAQLLFGDDIKQGAVVALLQNADLSSFIHESGHFFLEVMTDIASQEGAPQEIRDDVNTLLDWFGVKPGMLPGKNGGQIQATKLQMWRAMTLDQKREMHEKFARGFEAYAFEGKAPTVELQSLFARFRAWMLNVYQSLKNLNVELTDDVRKVFDRMVASGEQIRATEALRQMAPMFDNPRAARATEAEWKAYQELGAEATQRATEELERRSLADLKWAQNARSTVLKKLQAEADAKRAEIRKEVEAEVEKEPIYQAISFLRTGKLLEADRTNAQRKALEEAGLRGTKFSLPDLKEMYGDGPAAPWRYLSAGTHGLATADGGIHPDLVAELFGFQSGDELVRKILAVEPMESVIEGMTDQRMLERYGDLVDDKAIAKAADEAVHSEVRARFIASELRFLERSMQANQPTGETDKNGRPLQVNVLTRAAKAFAEQILARKKVKDIRPAQYAAAEARAAKAALKARTPVEKAVEKRNQLVNNYATRAAYAAKEEVEKALRYLRKFDRDGVRKGLDGDYLDQIDKLLERFDIRQATQKDVQKRKALADWIESQREQGYEPTIDKALIAEANSQHYSTMTLEEFRGLVDAVKNIEHLGRLKKKLLTAKAEREFAEVVTEIATSIDSNAKGTVKERRASDRGPLVSIGQLFRNFMADHRKFASLVREMDGWKDAGPMWEHIVRTMNDAGNMEASEREKATIKLGELFAPIFKGEKLSRKTYITAVNQTFTREELIGIALNMGNETNVERVMTGEKWTRAQLNAVLDTLSKSDWEFVQKVWDYLESFRPQIAAKTKRVTGVEPEWVEPTPVQTKYGIFKGGYYPIKYDPLRSTKSEADTAAEVQRQMERGLYVRAQTRRGHLEERVKSTGRPMRYDLGVITTHIDQVIHDLAWHEWLIDANRLLRSSAIDGAIRDHYGPEKLRSMTNTLRDIAIGDIGAQTAGDQVLTYLRHGSTIVGLGWRLSTALLQPIGLTQSAARIGTKWVLKGAAHWAGDAMTLENSAKKIYEKSEFMRLRGKTMQREVNEIRNKVAGKDSKIEASYFYMIHKMQLVADIPTWWGAYEKAMHENGTNEAKAIALADQAVMDAQGAGQVKDLAGVQRGSPAWKLFTNFYSFFNTTYNLTVEAVGRTNFRKPKDIGLLAVDLALLYTIPALLGTLLKAALKGDWDDKDKLIRRLIADQISYLLGTVVVVRELGGLGQKLLGLQGPDYSGPASVRLFNALEKLGQQTAQGELDGAFWKALNEAAGLVFHYPAGQINSTADGFMALVHGETKNPGVLITGAPKH